jgi:predicted ATPase
MDLLEREALMTRLAELLAVVRSGRGRIAMIAGEAGVGKTTLVEAFCARSARQIPVHWGACDPVQPPARSPRSPTSPTGPAIPFGPLSPRPTGIASSSPS